MQIGADQRQDDVEDLAIRLVQKKGAPQEQNQLPPVLGRRDPPGA